MKNIGDFQSDALSGLGNKKPAVHERTGIRLGSQDDSNAVNRASSYINANKISGNSIIRNASIASFGLKKGDSANLGKHLENSSKKIASKSDELGIDSVVGAAKGYNELTKATGVAASAATEVAVTVSSGINSVREVRGALPGGVSNYNPALTKNVITSKINETGFSETKLYKGYTSIKSRIVSIGKMGSSIESGAVSIGHTAKGVFKGTIPISYATHLSQKKIAEYADKSLRLAGKGVISAGKYTIKSVPKAGLAASNAMLVSGDDSLAAVGNAYRVGHVGVKTSIKTGKSINKGVRSARNVAKTLKSNGFRSTALAVRKAGGSAVSALLEKTGKFAVKKIMVPIGVMMAFLIFMGGANAAISGTLFGGEFVIDGEDYYVRDYMLDDARGIAPMSEYLALSLYSLLSNDNYHVARFLANDASTLRPYLQDIIDSFPALEYMVTHMQPIFNGLLIREYELETTASQAANLLSVVFNEASFTYDVSTEEWCGQCLALGIGEYEECEHCGEIHAVTEDEDYDNACPNYIKGYHSSFTCPHCCVMTCGGHGSGDERYYCTLGDGCSNAVFYGCDGYKICDGHDVITVRYHFFRVNPQLARHFVMPLRELQMSGTQCDDLNHAFDMLDITDVIREIVFEDYLDTIIWNEDTDAILCWDEYSVMRINGQNVRRSTQAGLAAAGLAGDFLVHDLTTGISFWGNGTASPGYHVDWVYRTRQDWEFAMVIAGRSWRGRPAIVEFSGNYFAVAYHTFDHHVMTGVGFTPNPHLPGGFTGMRRGHHMCMHAFDSILCQLGRRGYNTNQYIQTHEAVQMAESLALLLPG